MTNLTGNEKLEIQGVDGRGYPSARTEHAFTSDIAALASVSVSVKNYGAVGNGINDDTQAIQAAINANPAIFFPAGTYKISNTITIQDNKLISGAGVQTIVQATGSSYDVFQVLGSYNIISNIKTQNGLAGFRFFGKTSPCVANSMLDVQCAAPQYGIVLDGYQTFANVCYWNNFFRVLVLQPAINGILLTKSGSGDTPNANKFHSCRVYSLSASIAGGDGIYVQYGNYNNSFLDCESNLSTNANSCVRIGANANQTLFTNLYTETTGSVTNVQLDSGSGSVSKNIFINLFPASAGAAIADVGLNGNFITVNSNATTNTGNWFTPSVNIGWPVNVVSNTLQAPFQIHGLNSNTSNMGMFIYLNNNVGTRVSLNKSRSTTLGNQGAVTNNDDIGYVDFNASDNSHFLASAQIRASVDNTVSPGQGYVSGRLSFLTSPQNNGGLLEAMRVDSGQNVVQGTAAIATTATNGFMYIATCAGAPTGVPNPPEGVYTGRVAMVYDTVNHKFWIYDGGWKGTVLS